MKERASEHVGAAFLDAWDRQATAVETFDDPMSHFVDPVAALLVEDARIAQHKTSITVWVDKVKAIVLPVIKSYTFRQVDLDAMHEAHALCVVDKASDTRGKLLLKSLKETRREVTTYYEALRRPFNQVAKAVIALEDRDAVPVGDAEQVLGDKLNVYDAAEAERERQERARKQAEADECARQEQLAAAAAVTRVAEATADPIVAAALQAEAQGIASVPAVAAKVSVTSQRAQVRGVSVGVQHYNGEVTDKRAFVQAVLDGKIELDAIEIKQSWVKAKAEDLKDELTAKFPFIKLVKTTGTRG